MQTKFLHVILNLLPALEARSLASPAAAYLEEVNRCIDQAQKASELMDTASSDETKEALRFAGLELLDAATAAHALSRDAFACEMRYREALRTAAAELAAILKAELAPWFHARHDANGETLLNIASPKVAGEILLEIARLDAIAADDSGAIAITEILDVMKASIQRAAWISTPNE